MVKIQESGGQYRITIPKELLDLLRWKKGEEIVIAKYPEKNILYLEKVKP